jgi:hypothetical protein
VLPTRDPTRIPTRQPTACSDRYSRCKEALTSNITSTWCRPGISQCHASTWCSTHRSFSNICPQTCNLCDLRSNTTVLHVVFQCHCSVKDLFPYAGDT